MKCKVDYVVTTEREMLEVCPGRLADTPCFRFPSRATSRSLLELNQLSISERHCSSLATPANPFFGKLR